MYLIDIDLFVLYFSKVDQFNFLSEHIIKTACVVNIPLSLNNLFSIYEVFAWEPYIVINWWECPIRQLLLTLIYIVLVQINLNLMICLYYK